MAGDSHAGDEGRFVADGLTAGCAALLREGRLDERVAEARRRLESCRCCPRACGADRAGGAEGRCLTAGAARVVSVFPHMGEESCLVGRRGSGAVFFGGCSLGCVFCQNADISQTRSGEPCPPERLADLALQLQDWGCANLNLVSPGHVVPQVVEALALAAARGLTMPVVYNSGGYDDVDSLRLLEGLVDVYMPDFKFWTRASAERYCGAADYPERARAALREMHRQVGDLVCDREGRARRGLLVRHLVMPGLGGETEAILRWLADELSPDTWLNLMDQYRPCHLVGAPDADGRPRYPELDRRPDAAELSAARRAAGEAGLWRGDR